MTEHDETLSVGELQAALSNAIVRIMRDFYGKGAARSRTTIFDEYVFVVLEDVLTTAEMTLRNGGAGELVRKVRMRFEDVMTSTFVGEVERLTGRTVVAYHSQVVLEPPAASRSSCWIPRRTGIGAPEQRRRAGARRAISRSPDTSGTSISCLRPASGPRPASAPRPTPAQPAGARSVPPSPTRSCA